MLLIALMIALAAPSPTPAPQPSTNAQIWHPLPHGTEPPESPEKINHDLMELRISASNLVYGLLAPYCTKYGGLVNATPTSESQPYPVHIQCANKTMDIEAPK